METVKISAPQTKRKRRNDRNHLLYRLTNQVTGEVYIGMTVVSCRAWVRSLNERWKRHVHRALNESHDWKLCESIRAHGPKNFKREIIEVVRGKPEAHRKERDLINTLKPTLNTF